MGINRWDDLARQMREAIYEGKLTPGTRIPPESVLATEWGVSRMTVHRVMQELQAAGLVERRRRVGSVVLAQRRLKSVAVVMFDPQVNPQARFLQGISQGLPKDCDLILFDNQDSVLKEREVLESLEGRADALIIYPTSDPENTPALVHLSAVMPVVCIDRIPDGFRCDAFVTDEYESALEGMRLLAKRGHTRIAHFTDDLLNLTSVRGRLDAYLAVISEQGTLTSKWLRTFRGSRLHFSAFVEQIYAVFETMMRGPEAPTAIFCGHDHYMSAVLASCNRLNLRVPQDLEILTVNDTPNMPVFMIDQVHRIVPQTVKLGQLAAERIIELSITPKQDPVIVALRSELHPAVWLEQVEPH